MKKADFIIISAVAVIVGVLLFFLYGVNHDPGTFVQIEIDGKVAEVLPLDTDATMDIEDGNGGTNTLVIENGCAKVVSANCPDGICTNHKKINKNGESIICLPHKVVVTVVNDSDADSIDAVA